MLPGLELREVALLIVDPCHPRVERYEVHGGDHAGCGVDIKFPDEMVVRAATEGAVKRQ